ncbi:hypothetical protein P43SY_009492 [Pythium insidiosum]|uniref:Uncharacterized protein n=1 Tax=Pythium insidiosum TaxID=114742 RepID=A0AAD5LGS4_PYTIN|nr:hypothetical protein P43SY_009492 [Pythium insidiosum]
MDASAARVVFCCALFSLQCCVTVLGNISRDTLFLRSYHASSLSTLTLLLSVTTAYALTAATQQLAALAVSVSTAGAYYAATPAALGAGLFALALCSLAAPATLARATSVAIYMWLEIAAQLLASQFWDLCAKAFDVSESKKFFGVLMMIVSLAWAMDAMAARKSYAAEFYASLKQGYLDLSSPLVDFTPDQLALIENEIREHFGERSGVDILLDTMSCEERHIELSCLALQYYLHVAEDHASCVTTSMAIRFRDSVLPHLVHNELARELLVEVYHSP